MMMRNISNRRIAPRRRPSLVMSLVTAPAHLQAHAALPAGDEELHRVIEAHAAG